ncbi:MAG: hypothetical protein C0404_06725 [Verrucomicrobia bacterium]|nr:hypothetical protein [Verrucomicrobiota bacterium]
MNDKHTEMAHCRDRDISITDIKLRFVEDGHDGLLAWSSCTLGNTIVLNNIAIRRGRDGGLMLTFPAKQTSAGTRFYYFNPISREASAALETAIIGKVREFLGPAVVPVEGGRADDGNAEVNQ